MNDAQGASTRASVKRLSTNPHILFEQAACIEKWCAGVDEDDEQRYLLLFGRFVQSESGAHWQIAGYFCRQLGDVISWRTRFDISGENYKDTASKLCFGIVNRFIEPRNIENIK